MQAVTPPLFDGIPFLEVFAGQGITNIRWIAEGVQLFRQGGPADALFYLHDGRVKLITVSSAGREAVVGLLTSGDFIGEGCLRGQDRRLSTAVAITRCRIARLEKDHVISTLREHPRFAEAFISHLLQRNERLEADLIDQLFNSSEKRLARLLLILANLENGGAKGIISPKISQETLANMIGTTRSRVNFFMNKFRKLGYIDYDGELIVRSSLLTVVLRDRTDFPASGPTDEFGGSDQEAEKP
jgi:CRP-like cAMP-binding protein